MSAAATAIWVKDCRSALRSPVAWCGFAGSAAVCAALFAAGLKSAGGADAWDSFPALFCSRLLLSLCVPVSLFTMGLFAREQSRGTFDMLLAAPVSERELVLAKFFAAFALVCVSTAFAFGSALVYLRLAAPPPPFIAAEMCGAAVAAVLAASAWTAAGTFFSVLSYHQPPACAATAAASLGSAALFTRSFPGFNAAAMPDLADFARGTADSRVIFAALSLTVFLLACAIRVLQFRRCGR